MFLFVLKELYFMLVEQEIFTLPEQLSSPTDFDQLRKRRYWLIVEDDHICSSSWMTGGIVFVFVLKELYYMLVEQELLTLPKHLCSHR